MTQPITITQAQQKVDDWIKRYGVRYFAPLTNLGILMEETGELARLMVRRYGEQSFKPGTERNTLADEMADILWVLCALANQCGVDLEEAFESNMAKKTMRDASRHLENSKLSDPEPGISGPDQGDDQPPT